MQQRCVLITGCSSGIGRTLADGLRARGYRVFAGARKTADVAALADAGFDSVHLDLSSSESIHRAVDSVLERSDDCLYALINNAGYGQPGAVEDISRSALREQFEVNLFGTHELTTRLIPLFRAQNGGRIIQISSLLGLVAFPYRGAYTASKFALEALSDTMRLELRGSGVYVSLVEPGPIATEFRNNARQAYDKNLDPSRSAHRFQYQAMQRRLRGADGPPPFARRPEAVLKKVVHALEARRPRARYPVTVPAHVFTVLRRILPQRALDYILATTSKGGAR